MSEQQRPDLIGRIERDYTYYTPTAEQTARYERVRATAKELAQLILTLSPISREQSLALTHLEEATFWCNAAIARHL